MVIYEDVFRRFKKEKVDYIKAINYYKPGQLSEVDIIIHSPASFEVAKKKVKICAVNDLKLPVVSIDGLIKMKAKTGRAVDKYDVAELRKVKRMISK